MTAAEPLGNAVADYLRKIMTLGTDVTALITDEHSWTWGAVSKFGQTASGLIADAGIPRGTPVALVVRNRASGIAAFLSLMVEGWPPVLVSPIQPSSAIAAAVDALNPAAVLADDQDWSDELRAVVMQCGTLGIALHDEQAELRARVTVPAGPVESREHLRVAASTAVVVPTSGTTGPPKPIELAWDRLPLSTDVAARRPFAPEERPPVIHALATATITGFGAVIRALGRGRSLVLMERLDVQRWTELVRRYKPRRIGLPPAAMRMMIDAKLPRDSLKSLEAWITGSAPLDPELQLEFEQFFGVPVLVAYGATEFAGSVANWSLEDHRHWAASKLGSVGRAVPGVKLRIVDPASGAILKPGDQGLLEVQLQRSEDWMRTNDLARLDADGFLFIDGRADDVLVRGGFKVSLGEVRDVFRSHPGVREAAAVDLPDRRLGQVPAVAVVLHEGSTADADELMRWARERMAPYKLPTTVAVVDDLPLGASHKINRTALRESLSLLQAEAS